MLMPLQNICNAPCLLPLLEHCQNAIVISNAMTPHQNSHLILSPHGFQEGGIQWLACIMSMSFIDTLRAPRWLTQWFGATMPHSWGVLTMHSQHLDCESCTMGGAIVISKPTVYCLLSQPHTPSVYNCQPIQPFPPNYPSAKSFFVHPLHLYLQMACTKQTACKSTGGKCQCPFYSDWVAHHYLSSGKVSCKQLAAKSSACKTAIHVILFFSWSC